MAQLVYTVFISNNRASFHLWSMENLLKHQKVSKYYGSVVDTPVSTVNYFRKKLHLKCWTGSEYVSGTGNYFRKCFILDVWLGFKNTFDIFKETFYFLHEYKYTQSSISVSVKLWIKIYSVTAVERCFLRKLLWNFYIHSKIHDRIILSQ